MELTIDLLPCDLGITPIAVPAFDADSTADPEACREGRTLRLTLPATPRNAAAVCFADDPHAAEGFNAGPHLASLTAEGASLLSGRAVLLKVSGEGYELEIRDGGGLWAEQAAQRMFNTLGVAYSGTLTPTAICASWTEPTPVRFFPVHRDEYPQSNGPADLLPAERLLSVEDYHPFLHLRSLVGRIFEEADYRIRSRFFDSAFFQSLYMSGAYPSRETAAATARMGFRAGRLSAATATANHLGRVYADPAALDNTLGNLVHTATPQSVDADGETVPGLYNHTNCFGLQNGRIVFTPPVGVSAGFAYYLRYTTDHRILTRERLCGFDTFYLGPGARVTCWLANRHADRREQLTANHSYRALVFDHKPGAQYRLTCTHNGIAGRVLTEFGTRSATLSTPASGTVSSPVLLELLGNLWRPCAGDWALYDGHIGERGRTTVEIRLRTAAETLSPGVARSFDRIFLSGAEPGMSLTLHKQSTLEVRFLSAPGFGSKLTFADVAQHRMRQIGLLEALAHLFNLRFYTEPGTRTVWIEPAEEFFGAGPEVDWSGRTDFSQGVTRSQLAPQLYRHRAWGYQPGDGAVTRFDTLNESSFGRWEVLTRSFAAREGGRARLNPLFAPTLSSRGHYLNAPSARLLQVGDRDDLEQDGTNFTPRIVCYAGLHPLAAGERWGFPSGRSEYPLAAFHFAGDEAAQGFTLCFEDRDGVRGLHRYYDARVAREESRERISLSLRLSPHEYAALFTPGTGAPDLRSVFRLDTGSGVVRTILHAIGPYDPRAGWVRCTFDRLSEDQAP